MGATLYVMPAHSTSKTGVNALMSRASTSYTTLDKDVDGRDKPGHDDRYLIHHRPKIAASG